MKTIHYIIVLISFATLSMAQSAEEAVDLLQDEQGVGIRAAALGRAYTGVADDYSAIYWNPAGLAQIRNNEVSIALSHLKFGSEATYLSETNSDTRSFTKLHNFGMVYPFAVSRGSLVMAFGYQRIKSLDSYLNFAGDLNGSKGDSLAFDIINEYEYDYGLLEFDRNIRQNQSNSSEGSLSLWSFGMAVDVTPRFSAGLTLSLISGGSDYMSQYRQDDINNMNHYDIYDSLGQPVEEFLFKHYDVTQKLQTDYSGLEAKLGGLFRVGEHIRLGGTITLPMTIRVNEVWSVSDELAYDIKVREDGSIYSYAGPTEDPYADNAYIGWVLNTKNVAVGLNNDGVFDYNIKVPFHFSSGLSFQNNFLLLTGAAEYTDWSQLRYEMPDDRDSEDYTPLLSQNDRFTEDYRGVLSWGVGAEVNLFRDALSLRGGYRVVPSPFKDSSVGYDKSYYSAGLGMRLDKGTMLEATYIYGSHKRDAYYSYNWDEYGEIDPMHTSETYTSQKMLVGIKLIF